MFQPVEPRSFSKIHPSRRMTAMGLCVSLAACFTALAAPPDIHVTSVSHGNAKIKFKGNDAIIRAGNNAIINYDRFNFGNGSTVRFIQPNANSRVLNRIDSTVPSHFDGLLRANGRVYFVNPAGIIFGPNSVLNVGHLYAAAANITDSNFLNDVNRFTDAQGAVMNYGEITAEQVHLVGKQVGNYGSIIAPNGVVTMAAGSDVYLGENNGRVIVRVNSDGSLPQLPPGQGLPIEAGDIYSLAIRQSGNITADQVSLHGGTSGVVKVSGSIDASNLEAGEVGGRVKILGDDIQLRDATINASGDGRGGKVWIGGDTHGEGSMPRATSTNINADTRIYADSMTRGGGNIIVWSDEITTFKGELYARAFGQRGTGGFAEVSSAEHLRVSGHAYLGGANGSKGEFLLDPGSVDIVDGPNTGPPPSQDTFNDAWVVDQLNTGGADLTISTESSTNALLEVLTVEANAVVSWNSSNNLTLTGADQVSVQGTISNAGSGDITLNGGQGSSLQLGNPADIIVNGTLTQTGSGSITLNASTDTFEFISLVSADQISLNGGTLTVTGADVSSDTAVDITMNGGEVNFDVTGFVSDVTLVNTGDVIIKAGSSDGITASPNESGHSLTLDFDTDTGFGEVAGPGGAVFDSINFTGTNAGDVSVNMTSGSFSWSSGQGGLDLNSGNGSLQDRDLTLNVNGFGGVTIGDSSQVNMGTGSLTLTTGAATVQLANDPINNTASGLTVVAVGAFVDIQGDVTTAGAQAYEGSGGVGQSTIEIGGNLVATGITLAGSTEMVGGGGDQSMDAGTGTLQTTGALQKSTAGNLTLLATGQIDLNGNVAVDAGDLEVMNEFNAAGSLTASGATMLLADGILDGAGTQTIGDAAGEVFAGGTLTKTSTGNMTIQGADGIDLRDNVSANIGNLIVEDAFTAGGNLSASDTTTMNGDGTLDGAGAQTIGSIAGSVFADGTLTKTTAGDMTVRGGTRINLRDDVLNSAGSLEIQDTFTAGGDLAASDITNLLANGRLDGSGNQSVGGAGGEVVADGTLTKTTAGNMTVQGSDGINLRGDVDARVGTLRVLNDFTAGGNLIASGATQLLADGTLNGTTNQTLGDSTSGASLETTGTMTKTGDGDLRLQGRAGITLGDNVRAQEGDLDVMDDFDSAGNLRASNNLTLHDTGIDNLTASGTQRLKADQGNLLAEGSLVKESGDLIIEAAGTVTLHDVQVANSSDPEEITAGGNLIINSQGGLSLNSTFLSFGDIRLNETVDHDALDDEAPATIFKDTDGDLDFIILAGGFFMGPNESIVVTRGSLNIQALNAPNAAGITVGNISVCENITLETNQDIVIHNDRELIALTGDITFRPGDDGVVRLTDPDGLVPTFVDSDGTTLGDGVPLEFGLQPALFASLNDVFSPADCEAELHQDGNVIDVAAFGLPLITGTSIVTALAGSVPRISPDINRDSDPDATTRARLTELAVALRDLYRPELLRAQLGILYPDGAPTEQAQQPEYLSASDNEGVFKQVAVSRVHERLARQFIARYDSIFTPQEKLEANRQLLRDALLKFNEDPQKRLEDVNGFRAFLLRDSEPGTRALLGELQSLFTDIDRVGWPITTAQEMRQAFAETLNPSGMTAAQLMQVIQPSMTLSQR